LDEQIFLRLGLADAQQRDTCMQSMAAPMMAADDQGDKSFLGSL
jgi:hypothetical protein